MSLRGGALLIALLLSLHKVSAQDVGGSRQVKLASTLKRLEQVLARLKSRQLIVVDTTKSEMVDTFPKVKRNVTLNIPQFQLDKRSDKKVICYYDANDRSRPQTLNVLNIDKKMCTHFIVQEFYKMIIMPDNATFEIEKMKSIRPEVESQVGELIASSKVLLSLGNSGKDDNKKYSMLVSNKTSRTNFINHLAGVLTRDKFAGLNIYWSHPACWITESGCKNYRSDDKKYYALFVQEISAVLKPLGLLLTCALPLNTKVYERGFDMEVFNKHMDWMVLQLYGWRGPWDDVVDRFSGFADFTLGIVIAKVKTDLKKLVAGISASTVTFTLRDKKRNTPQSPSKGQGKPGIFSNNTGHLDFYELCYMIHTEKWSTETKLNPSYAFKDDQWISYDDMITIRQKMQHVMTEGLAGAALLNVNHDDFMDLCGCGRFPLLRAINEELRGARAVLPNCT